MKAVCGYRLLHQTLRHGYESDFVHLLNTVAVTVGVEAKPGPACRLIGVSLDKKAPENRSLFDTSNLRQTGFA